MVMRHMTSDEITGYIRATARVFLAEAERIVFFAKQLLLLSERDASIEKKLDELHRLIERFNDRIFTTEGLLNEITLALKEVQRR